MITESKTEILNAKRNAELALGDSERRYHQLLASTTDYVYTVTVHRGSSVATTHGARCEVVTGYTSLELHLDPALWYRMIFAEDRMAVLAQVAQLLRGELPAPLEHRILHKNGTVRWIRNTVVPQKDNEGHVTSYNGVISDITERKLAEQYLAVQYAVARHLADAATHNEAVVQIFKTICTTFPWDWAALWSRDTNANVLRWSGVFHSGADQFESFSTRARAMTFPRGVSLPGRVWIHGEAVWIPDVVKDESFLRRSAAAAGGLHSACAFPIYVQQEIAGVIELLSRTVQQPEPKVLKMFSGVGEQIGRAMGQKRAEQARKAEHILLRTVIDNLPDYIFVKDHASRFLMNNVAHFRLLGASQQDQVIGATDADFFPKELADRYRGDEESVLRSGEPLLNREEPVAARSGEQKWVLTSKVPLKDDYGSIIGLIGVSRDITERKESEERLRSAYTELSEIELRLQQTYQTLEASYAELKTTQLQLIQAAKLESIGTLAAGVAHQVKNPLQTILLGLDYLRHRVSDGEGAVSTLNDMRDAVKRADAIVRELLQFSSTTKFEMTEGCLNRVIERVLRLIDSDLLASKTNVVLLLASNLPPTVMDPAKIEQVFLNLFINAMQAMPSGGTLTITTRVIEVSSDLQVQQPMFRPFKPFQRVAVAEVHDTGDGFTEASLAKILTPFFTTKPPGIGTGLGLPVAKRIIDLHGGSMDIKNAAQGGALATLVLNVSNSNAKEQ